MEGDAADGDDGLLQRTDFRDVQRHPLQKLRGIVMRGGLCEHVAEGRRDVQFVQCVGERAAAKLRLEILHGHAGEEVEHEREVLQVVAGNLADGVENGGSTQTVAFDKQVAACDGDAAAFAVENRDLRLLDVCLVSCSKPWCGDGYAC